MSTKHTPGPWSWELYARGYALVGAAPRHSSVPQPVVVSHASADGRLIAAAPDLLDALHAASAALDYVLRGTDDPRIARDLATVNAAISKAESQP
mgnify:CR=1 FL=1